MVVACIAIHKSKLVITKNKYSNPGRPNMHIYICGLGGASTLEPYKREFFLLFWKKYLNTI